MTTTLRSDVELPLFPLNTVLYPTNHLPLRIFEPRYVDMIGRCMRDNTQFGVIAISQGAETGSPAQTFNTGTFAKIVDFDQGTDGLLNIVILGEGRFELSNASAQADNLLIGTVNMLDDVEAVAIPEDFENLSGLLSDIQTSKEIPTRPGPVPTTAADLAYALAHFLPMSLTTKVSLLEMNDPLALLERLSSEIEYLRENATE